MEKEKLKKLIDLSNELRECYDLDKGLNIATQKIKEIIEVDRVTVFIYSARSNMLWTYLADGIEKLVIPANKGIVGYVVQNKTIKKVNDTSKEPLFYKEIDEMTGYKTKNILTVPLVNDNDKLIGVIQLLNKNGNFTPQDINIAHMFSIYITPALELLLEKKGNNNDYII
jgi:GAF domain-containing protein